MKALGILLANQTNHDLKELTKIRTLAAVPFGGRYRLIDFPLSNMANAGMTHIGVIMNRGYNSLMQHLALGDDWDLNRKTGGLVLLPPFQEHLESNGWDDRLRGLIENKYFLINSNEKYVVMSDCTHIENIDLSEAFEFHKNSDADVTVLTSKVVNPNQGNETHTYIRVDEETHRVTEVCHAATPPEGTQYFLHTWISERTFLIDLIEKAEANKHPKCIDDLLFPYVDERRVMAYEHEGPVLFIDNLSEYLESNLALLNRDIQTDLFRTENRPIFTNTQDSAPTKFGKHAVIKNSYIAAGCVIDGHIENSVIFRGAKVEQGAVIENCVIMEGAEIGRNAKLNYAVLDKHVTIHNNRHLSGYITHPFFCGNRQKI